MHREEILLAGLDRDYDASRTVAPISPVSGTPRRARW